MNTLHFFCLFRGAPVLHGSSPARALIRAKSEPNLQATATATATATAMPDLSHIHDLCLSLQQCQILSPLTRAKDQTHIPTDTMSCSQQEVLFFFFFFFCLCLFKAKSPYGGEVPRLGVNSEL